MEWLKKSIDTFWKLVGPLDFRVQCLSYFRAYVLKQLCTLSIDFPQLYYPYEKLYEKKPNISHMRTIRCLYYANIVQQSDKLQPRSRECLLMGYSDI